MRCRFVIAIALTIGCRDDGVAKLEAVRDEVCACKTAACGEEAIKKLPGDGKTSPRARKVAKDVVDCLQKLLIKREDHHDHEDDGHDDGSAAAGAGSGSAKP